MKSLIRNIRLAWLKFQIRSLEIELEGKTEALLVVRSERTRMSIYMAREKTRADLAVARKVLTDLLPKPLKWGVYA